MSNQKRRGFQYQAKSPLDAMVQEPNSERKKVKKLKSPLPPEVILDYQYPDDSLLRVRVVKQVDEDGEISYSYEQSTEVDAMEQPVWESPTGPTACDCNLNITLRRVVDLFGEVICGKIKTFPPT